MKKNTFEDLFILQGVRHSDSLFRSSEFIFFYLLICYPIQALSYIPAGYI